jgi:hypothetical protein
VVVDPEGLSGLWETSNGHGGAVGIHLQLATSVAADAKWDGKTLAGVQQLWQYLEVGVYERAGAVLVFGEENFFSDSPRGAHVTVEEGRLQLHFVSQWADTPSVDLDLVKQPGDRWVGRLHRGSFDSQVTLERPGAGAEKRSALAGTWMNVSTNECMHIAERGSAEFTGWSDSLQLPNEARCMPPAERPSRVMEIYGDLIKVQEGADGTASFEFGAYNAMCCSNVIRGRPNADGGTIEVAWPLGPWKKMPGDSCLFRNSSQTAHQ